MHCLFEGRALAARLVLRGDRLALPMYGDTICGDVRDVCIRLSATY